ncbi:MAG: hypothetical protein KME09_04590 [Pleurocapsa minor HA4230-MV1]|jgi:hypothetical protein|nr:hypothetical protein [Pleurocapsa minor HA4230-MV1]
MSKYKIDSEQYLIYVGYDQPLRTFFATVEDLNLSEDEDGLLLWVGTDYDEITDLNQLDCLVAEYSSIPDEIILKLDEDSKQPFEPSPFQIQTETFFAPLLKEQRKLNS